MAQNIVINILPRTNENPSISIQATLTRKSSNIRNRLFVCNINNINPASADIPQNSAEAGVLSILFENGMEESCRDWKIRSNGDTLILKTYSTPSAMRLDTNF